MRILFLNQFFWPDSSATSQLLTDLTRGLVARGHDVSVICGEGGYAPEVGEEAPAVHIERVKALPFARGRVGRVFSYLSFYLLAFTRACLFPRVDVVVSLTTPPLICLLGSWLKALRGSRHFIWEMDVYPDVAVDLKHFRAGGLADRLTGALADYSRRQSDGVIALGECMKRRLVQRGISASNIYIAENWADGSAIKPIARRGDPNQLVLLYSGNLGLAHDLDTIVGSMNHLRADPRFQFLFVGGGGRREELVNACSVLDLKHVQLRTYAPRECLSESLSLGDIGLVTQQDVCCGSVVPSKVYGILAAGRPILFIGPRDSTAARIVLSHGCGWQVDCGDDATLTSLLLHLIESRHEVVVAGEKARSTFLQHYDISIGIRNITSILELSRAPSHSADDPRRAALHPSTPGVSTHFGQRRAVDEEEATCPLSQR